MVTRIGVLLLMVVLTGACGGEDAAEPDVEPAPEDSPMQLSSPAFQDQETIPTRFTCDGEDVSPPLEIEGVPEQAEALVLVMDDPDAPGGTFDHWVLYDIPPDTTSIPEGGSPGTPGLNSFDRTGYGGPCPPSGTHRYIFRLFAIDSELGLEEGADKEEVLAAIEGRVLAEATLTGRYSRSG